VQIPFIKEDVSKALKLNCSFKPLGKDIADIKKQLKVVHNHLDEVKLYFDKTLNYITASLPIPILNMAAETLSNFIPKEQLPKLNNYQEKKLNEYNIEVQRVISQMKPPSLEDAASDDNKIDIFQKIYELKSSQVGMNNELTIGNINKMLEKIKQPFKLEVNLSTEAEDPAKSVNLQN
jgi:hypothetical protein